MVSDNEFKKILLYIQEQGWIENWLVDSLFDHWSARPENEKDLFQLEAYLDDYVALEEISHLLDQTNTKNQGKRTKEEN